MVDCGGRRVRRAWQLFDWVRGLPAEHALVRLCDSEAYTTMIALCGPWQQLRRALHLIADMDARGIECGLQVPAPLPLPAPSPPPPAGLLAPSAPVSLRLPHTPSTSPELSPHSPSRAAVRCACSPPAVPCCCHQAGAACAAEP